MSDFSELCPLFNTGIFHEVCFPGPMGLSTIGTKEDLLAGTTNQARSGYFTFGRTVVVTEAWIKRYTTNTIETTMYLKHKTSGTQALAGTIIGTCTLDIYMTAYQDWKPFVAFTGKTFTSDEVLAFVALSSAVDTGTIGLMVRYKDK